MEHEPAHGLSPAAKINIALTALGILVGAAVQIGIVAYRSRTADPKPAPQPPAVTQPDSTQPPPPLLPFPPRRHLHY